MQHIRDFDHYFMEFIGICMEYEDLMGMWWDIYIIYLNINMFKSPFFFFSWIHPTWWSTSSWVICPFFFFFLDSSRTLPPGLIAQNAVLASLPDSWLKRVVLSGNRSIIWPVDVCIYIYYACKHIMIYIYI